jgi:predicted permease
MTTILRDVSQAFRTLRKSPGFAASALVVLALGIGANTAIFSIVYNVLLQPLPYGHPDELVQLWHVPPAKSFPGMTQFPLSAANYLDWKSQNHVFESSAIYTSTGMRLTANGETQILRGSRVEPTFFSVLQTPAMLGRVILSGDDEGSRDTVVVLSHQLWIAQFGGDKAIVGKTIQLNGRPYTVIGVMPPTFVKPDGALAWVPLVWTPEERVVRGEHHWLAIARLRANVTLQLAQNQMNGIAERLAQQYPADNAGWGAKVVSLREETIGDVRKPLLILLGAVGFVLLIACANVANLILAKTISRQKEIAIRTALGANRARIVTQVLAEPVLIALAGGGAGLIVANFGTGVVIDFLGKNLPRLAEINLNGTVLAFTFAVAVATGILSGIVPAWRFSTADPNDALKQGLGRTVIASTGGRIRHALVVTEVALSLVLLVGAGLMVRTLWNLRHVNPGFDPGHVLTMRLSGAPGEYTNEDQQAHYFDQVLRRIRSVPGVEAAGVTDNVPLEGGSNQPIAIEGRPVVAMADQPEVSVRLVSADFFSALRIPVRRGRDFKDSDTPAAPAVIVVSESMAKRFWPSEDAIGKRLTLTFFPDHVREIVGVVGDVKDEGLSASETKPTLYWPISQLRIPKNLGQFSPYPLKLAVRVAKEPAGAASMIRNAIREVSPGSVVSGVLTMEEQVEQSISPDRFNTVLLGSFAALALVLATIGIYSVQAYAARLRTREIGIRLALGAGVDDILQMIVIQGMRSTVQGAVAGIVAASALGKLLTTLIYGVRTTDIATFVSVSALLIIAGFFASVVPAYRATRTDPLKILRDE